MPHEAKKPGSKLLAVPLFLAVLGDLPSIGLQVDGLVKENLMFTGIVLNNAQFQ